MFKKIAIIGNGNIGQAIFYLLNKPKKKYLLRVYDKKNSSKSTPLRECLTGADYVFLCIPSWNIREALEEIKPLLEPQTILISLAKGLDKKTQKSVDELIEKEIKNPYALMSGPMFALEITNQKMSFGVLATKNKKDYQKIAELFSKTKLKLSYSSEIHSVAISAVLKNIYSLLCGMFDGFGKNNNTKGYLSCQIVQEMRTIMQILKLDEETVLGISGLGDFIATASSEYSQNIKSGKAIYHNGSTIYKSEGLVSLPSLLKIIGPKIKNLPLLSLLKRILIDKKNPKEEIGKFFEGL